MQLHLGSMCGAFFGCELTALGIHLFLGLYLKRSHLCDHLCTERVERLREQLAFKEDLLLSPLLVFSRLLLYSANFHCTLVFNVLRARDNASLYR